MDPRHNPPSADTGPACLPSRALPVGQFKLAVGTIELEGAGSAPWAQAPGSLASAISPDGAGGQRGDDEPLSKRTSQTHDDDLNIDTMSICSHDRTMVLSRADIGLHRP